MSLPFTIEAQAGAGRAGRLQTAHGAVATPVFMPVGTQATVKGIAQETLEELGAEIILANTYHLYLRPGVDVVRQAGGLHGFMSWARALLTDSGGFQVFSLSALRKISEEGVEFRSHLDGSRHLLTPESATAAQIGLGADVIMAFDECTEHPAARERARDSMELTLRWAGRCKKYFEAHKEEAPWREFRVSSVKFQEGTAGAGNSKLETGNCRQALFGIVQGGMDAELRRESAERTVELDFDGYAIGGLSVGEPRESTQEMVALTLQHLPAGRPRYLMGVGTPEEIALYARMGVDMMDCVLPTRAARHGLVYTSEGRVNIKNARYAQDQGPLDPRCRCRVCARYTRAYLRHLYATGEALGPALNTVHNLAHYLDTMRAVRHSISFGELPDSTSGAHSASLGQVPAQKDSPA